MLWELTLKVIYMTIFMPVVLPSSEVKLPEDQRLHATYEDCVNAGGKLVEKKIEELRNMQPEELPEQFLGFNITFGCDRKKSDAETSH